MKIKINVTLFYMKNFSFKKLNKFLEKELNNQTILFMFIIIAIIYFISIYLKKKTDYKVYHKKKVLSLDECNKLIKLSNKYNFGTDPDSTDDKPEYQIDVLFSKRQIGNKGLWKEINPIYKKKLFPILKTIPFLSSIKFRLEFVFLKRYTPNERTHMNVHCDENFFTIGVLLSNPNDFSGGNLYVFDSKKTKKYRYIEDESDKKKNNFIKKYKNLPIINYNQGDIVIYSGENHLHGTLPVTSGERYVLIFFFEKI